VAGKMAIHQGAKYQFMEKHFLFSMIQ